MAGKAWGVTTIHRRRLYAAPGSNVMFAWKYNYWVVGPDGATYDQGTHLGSTRAWAKRRWPDTPIHEEWKQAKP